MVLNGGFGSGLNIFVGENNSGKSTLIESIYFLRNKEKNVKKIGVNENKEGFYVEADFVGNIEDVVNNFIQSNKQNIFKSRIFQEHEENIFRIKREFNNDYKIKKILFYNNEINEFKNESGIDAP